MVSIQSHIWRSLKYQALALVLILFGLVFPWNKYGTMTSWKPPISRENRKISSTQTLPWDPPVGARPRSILSRCPRGTSGPPTCVKISGQETRLASSGAFLKWGCSPMAGWFLSWKIAQIPWKGMMTGGTPILGNHHMIFGNLQA